MNPFRPSRRMAARDSTNGGEMMGKVAMSRKNRFQGTSALAMAKAKRYPTAVPATATSAPRIRLL